LEDWTTDGSALEDQQCCLRFLNHFHNPLRSWFQAGLKVVVPYLTFLGARIADSSILWGQTDDPVRQGWSWNTTREWYLQGLTAQTKTARDTALANTFRGLGHQIHLIQDAASPAHTRNDPHKNYNYETLVTALSTSTVGREQDLFEELFTKPEWTISKLAPGWSTLDSDPLAPVPIARLLDTDRYAGGNPGITTDGLIGLAEYTNANFFSEDTIFGRDEIVGVKFPYPARSSVVEEEMDLDLANGNRVKRRYYVKIGAGESGYRVATVGFLRDYIDRAAPAFDRDRLDNKAALDNEVYKDYAQRLVPRAVGYSQALLDYFFRGRLELGFSQSGAGSTGLGLSLINRSPEPLGPGKLSVFYDDPTGVRHPVPGGGVDVPGVVQPDEAVVPSLTLGPEAAANPLIVVYQGKLGSEASAVIGKVEDPVQVEEIFRGPTDWMLRTPTGVFPLGLGRGPGQVKWGDRDNTILAQTFLPGNDRRFETYRIKRPEGSRSVPLKPDPLTAEARVVDLEPWGPAVTLAGGDPAKPIDLGTRVSYTRIIDYSQRIVEIEGHFRYHWDPDIRVVSFFGTSYGDWVQDSAAFVTPSVVRTVYERTFTYSPPPFALTLDLKLPPTTPYYVSLLDVALNGDGDVVGLVQVFLATASGERVNHRRHNAEGVIEETGALYDIIVFDDPLPDLMVFAVNLTRRTVIGKSCADDVAMIYRTTEQLLLADLRYTAEGGLHATDSPAWIPALLAGRPTGSEAIVAEVTISTGVDQQVHAGLYRDEFERAGFADMRVQELTFNGPVTLADPFTRRSAVVAGGSLGGAVQLTSIDREPDPFATLIYDIRRSNGPEEGYTLLGWNLGIDRQQWSPFQWSARRAALAPLAPLSGTVSLPDTAGLRIGGANRASAAFIERRFDPVASEFFSITHLVTDREEFIFDGDLKWSYRFLEPSYLYNVDDLRFHRVSSALEPLPGPRPLASGGQAFGEYHVVGLR
jgi:hypothetical protein